MKIKEPQTSEIIKIKLPEETVTVGPGTVPTSGASTSSTSVKEMSTSLRKASRVGLFDSLLELEDETSTISPH